MGGSTGTARRRTWRWVTRDVEYSAWDVSIWFTSRKPTLDGKGLWWGHGKPGRKAEHKDLVELLGLSIQPGTCQKVQFTAKVVK